MRLMLPAWLGADEALSALSSEQDVKVLREMIEKWPFLVHIWTCWKWYCPRQTPHFTVLRAEISTGGVAVIR